MNSLSSGDVPEEARHIQKIPKVDPAAPPPPQVEAEPVVPSAPEDESSAQRDGAPEQGPDNAMTQRMAAPVAPAPAPAPGAATTGEQPPPPPVPGTSAGQPTENLTADDAPPVPSERNVPKLCDGVELLGEYEGSGFKEPRYLVRRGDGQLVQITALLHMIIEEIDGRRDVEDIAARVSENYGRTVSGENVVALLDSSLRRDGIVVGADGSTPQLKKPDPLLALKMKTTLVPERAVNFIAGLLRPLFWPPVIVAVLAALIALDIWYFGIHGIGGGLRDLLYQPLVVLLIYGLLILSVGFHELGHATACRYGGARPGKIGFGIYVVWPAFYTDVTDALKLGKAGRVRTDLGGVYFNAIFSLGVGGIYLLTGFEPILVLIVIQHMLMLYQFMPFLRLDGYHVVSDLTGIPDLFGRIKPTLKGLIPGQENPKQVTELKPWARLVVTIWVLTVIPVLLYLFGMMVLSAPRLLATGWDSFFVQWNEMRQALDGGRTAQAGVGGIRIAMLVLPLTGMGVTFTRTAKRIGAGAINITQDRPIARTGLATVGVAALATAVYVLIPNGEYKPIQPGEDWTFGDGIEAASAVTTGRPSLPEDAEEELGGAGFVSRGEVEAPAGTYGSGDAGTGGTDQETTTEEEPVDPAETPLEPEETPEETPEEEVTPEASPTE